LQSIFEQTQKNFIIFLNYSNAKDKFSLKKLNLNEINKKIRVGFRNKIKYKKFFNIESNFYQKFIKYV